MGCTAHVPLRQVSLKENHTTQLKDTTQFMHATTQTQNFSFQFTHSGTAVNTKPEKIQKKRHAHKT